MYPIDRRKISRHIYSLLNSLRATAKLVQVSHTTVSRWNRHFDKQPYSNENRTTKSKSFIISETLKAIIQCNPIITHQQIKAMIKDTFKFSISTELIRTILKRNNYTRKRVRYFGEAKDQEVKNNVFIIKRDRFLSENRLFFSLDETSFGRHGKPTSGYSLKGKQLRVKKSFPRVTTSSMMAIISPLKIVKTCIIHGSFNSEKFYWFMKDLDLPTGSVILLDNVRFHYSKSVADLCTSRNWEMLFVPPYSPWFNPIEEVFSIMKRAYYKDHTIEESIEKITQYHLQAFFQHALAHQGV